MLPLVPSHSFHENKNEMKPKHETQRNVMTMNPSHKNKKHCKRASLYPIEERNARRAGGCGGAGEITTCVNNSELCAIQHLQGRELELATEFMMDDRCHTADPCILINHHHHSQDRNFFFCCLFLPDASIITPSLAQEYCLLLPVSSPLPVFFPRCSFPLTKIKNRNNS